MRRFLALAACMLAVSAYAARVQVNVTTATEGYDYSASTSSSVSAITQVRITWGPCIVGAVNNGPPSEQTAVQGQTVLATSGATAVPGATVSLYAFPVGLSPVCMLAYNSDGPGGTDESGPTNVLVYTPVATPGQPLTLGQPIQFSSSSSSTSSASSSSCSGTRC